MPAFLPLSFTEVDVPVTPVPNGMSPLTDGYQLDGLAKKIRSALPPQLKGSDHSIPNIGAYIEYLRFEVLHNKHDSSYLKRWHGILAMIGLSKLYGFRLVIREIDMTHPAREVGGKVSPGPIYKREMERLGMLDHNLYYVICRAIQENGQEKELPLAVVDPLVLIIPLKNIAPNALTGIPWYNANADVWHEITEGYDAAPADTKRRLLAEHLQLAAWVNKQSQAAVSKRDTGLAVSLDAWCEELRHQTPLPADPKFGAIPCRRITPGGAAIDFGAFSQAAFCQVPDYQISMDGVELFTPRLTLTAAPRLCATSDRWDCYVRAASGQQLSILPPINADFAALLSQYNEPVGGTKQLELLRIRAVDEFAANNRITVEIVYRNGTLIVSRKQVYADHQIVYMQNFPYFSMWPYVNLQRDQWKLYTVSMIDHEQTAYEVENCECIDPKASRLGYVPDFGETALVQPRDDVAKQIWIQFSKEFPSFVPLQYMDELGNAVQCGCLLCEPEGNPVIPAGTTAKACIDFGTSNSVCVVEAGGITHEVLNGDRVRELVRFSSGSDQNDVTINDFHRYYGLSRSSRPYKFPSVAQLYIGEGSDPVRSGKILLAEQGVIDFFSKKNRNLETVGIFSYLKSDEKSPLAAVNQAEEVFIKHLTLLCALEAKCLGASNIEYYFSYPNEQYRNTLANFWNSAINYIDKMHIFAGITAPGYLTERAAAAYHVQTNMKKIGVAAAAKKPGFAVVDIGGGTSDITVWRAPVSEDDPIFREDKALINKVLRKAKTEGSIPAVQGANLSFRYAGNQLFSHTFFAYFKKNIIDMPKIFPKIFGFSDADLKAGSSKNKAAIDSIKRYMEALPEIPSLSAPEFSALTALLNALLEDPGVDMTFWGGAACKGLRDMISFKLKGILFVLGLLIGECAGIHPDNNIGDFQIYLVGGGAQAYNMTNKISFNEKAKEMLSQLPGMLFEGYDDTDMLRSRFNIIPPDPEGKKIEVVDGMLSYKKEFADLPNNDMAPQLPAEEETPNPEELRQAYQSYIEMAVGQDPDLKGLLPMLRLVPLRADQDERQKKIYHHYMSEASNMWDNLNRHLDADVSVVVRKAIFAVLMAEELLS